MQGLEIPILLMLAFCLALLITLRLILQKQRQLLAKILESQEPSIVGRAALVVEDILDGQNGMISVEIDGEDRKIMAKSDQYVCAGTEVKIVSHIGEICRVSVEVGYNYTTECQPDNSAPVQDYFAPKVRARKRKRVAPKE